jgi:integrase
MKNGLSGFIRYCDIKGVAPGQVDDRSADAYIEYLEREGARSKPRDVHRRTCKLWNEAAETVTDWPKQTITVPDYRAQPWTVSWESLPESFRQDVDQHLDWLGGKVLLADHLPPTVCKGSTLKLRRRHLHSLVSAAIHSGVPIETLTTLSELIDPDVVRKAMMYFLDRNEHQPTQYHRDLVGTVISIARHWVQADAQTLDALKEMRKRLSTRPEYGLTQKNRDALRQFESPENVARLLNLPDGLVKKATRLKSNERQAVQVQLALAVELLLMAPMRIGNLVSLRLDQHIQRPQGKRGPVFIVLNEAEVKNNLVQEYELPKVTVQLLDNYLQNYRPYLVDPDSPWLFAGGKEGHKLAATLSAQIQKVVYKETGLTLTAHQFRHLAAKFFLDASPGSYETVRRVLGHRNIKTTTNFYTGMETRAAVKQYDQAILGLREGDATGRSAGRGPSS